MTIRRNESELPKDDLGRANGKLIDASCGATKGFCLGVSYYDSFDWPSVGVHDDQEAIYILEGFGLARVGDQEFPVGPGVAFYVGKGVPHAIKRDQASPPLKGLWTHGAV